MSAAMYCIGGAVGLVFGSLVAYLNSLITRKILEKNLEKQKPEGTAAVMGINAVRQLVNVAALAAVFFTRKTVLLPFAATIIGTAIGLSSVSFLLLLRLSKKYQ